MRKIFDSRKLLIEASLETRKNIIKKDYLNAEFDINEVIQACIRLERYIGKAKISEYISLAEQSNFEPIIEELMTKYYDIAYNTKKGFYEHSFFNTDASITAGEIISYINKAN